MISDGVFASLLARGDLDETQLAEHPFMAQMRNKLKPQMTLREDGIAVIPIHGLLARKPDVFELFDGMEDSVAVLEMVQAAAVNPAVKGALFDVDSPGGFMQGGPEIADVIRSFGKPTGSFVGGIGASLAYWIASQASFVVASISASVGSIGGYSVHVDQSRMLESRGIKIAVIKNKEADFKAAGVMGTQLSELQLENIQQSVQEAFQQFRSAVKSARPQIKDDAMRGQTFSGASAKSAGLIDAVGSMAFALSLLKRQMR